MNIYIYVCIRINKIYGLYNISYISFRSAISPPSPHSRVDPPSPRLRTVSIPRLDPRAMADRSSFHVFFPIHGTGFDGDFRQKNNSYGVSDVSDGLSMFKSK